MTFNAIIDDLIARLMGDQGVDRKLDALMALHLIGIPAGTRAVALRDKPTYPLCLFQEHPMAERTRKMKEQDGVEVLNFEHEGKWLLFVADRVPAYTGSLDAAITLFKTVPSAIPSDPRKVCLAALTPDDRMTAEQFFGTTSRFFYKDKPDGEVISLGHWDTPEPDPEKMTIHTLPRFIPVTRITLGDMRRWGDRR